MSRRNPILDQISKDLEAERNFAPPETMLRMRPSSIGTPCLRRIYYKYLLVPPDYGWKTHQIKIVEKGTYLHLMIKRWLKLSGMLIEYRDVNGQIPINPKTGELDPEFPVSDDTLSIKNGKMDGIGIMKGIEGLKDGLWVFEIKSINKRGFQNYILAGPKPDHKEQAMVYAFLLERGLQEGTYSHIKELDGIKEVQGVIFIYINRESDIEDWTEFHVPKDEETFLSTVSKIMKTKKHVENDTLPPKTEDFCKWCDYRDKCARNYKVEKASVSSLIISKKIP